MSTPKQTCSNEWIYQIKTEKPKRATGALVKKKKEEKTPQGGNEEKKEGWKGEGEEKKERGK